jgi:RNA polymerase sigma-70 factor (ECF subfamily)
VSDSLWVRGISNRETVTTAGLFTSIERFLNQLKLFVISLLAIIFSALDERNLIDQLKQGDEAAFRTIVQTWQDMVYNTALGIVQNEQDAEDIAQDVFVQVYQSVSGFKGESKFSTWLYRITITKALDHERRKKRKKRFGLIKSLFGDENQAPAIPDFQHPGVLLDNKEHAKVLFAAITQLPENQRIAFALHKIEGLSYQEVSEVMNTSVSSVESLMHRAKNNLKKNLEEYYKKNS